MARKGWDALSDNYRRRLQRKGISKSAYESGSSLHKARGHSQAEEAFRKRATRFVHAFGVPDGDPSEEIRELKDMGRVQGQAYMDYRREMTRLYESGRYLEAEAMYKQRDKSLAVPDYMWWYHGMFGG